MTLAEIKGMSEDFLTVAQVAECLKQNPQTIRDQAQREPKWLGFPICQAGKSFRIPREGFIAWATGQTPMMVYQEKNTGTIR